MFDKNLQKDTSFIILATLLIVFYTLSNYLLSSRTVENLLIPGFCFAFAFVTIAWILTHRSHLRKTWPYLTIFILTFFYISYWKLIFILFSPNIDYHQPTNYEFIKNIIYIQPVLKFFIVLALVFIFWYLIKPKDFKNTKYFFLKKENRNKTIISIAIPVLMTISFWVSHVIYFFNKSFFSDLFFSNENLYHLYIFLYRGIPFFFAAILFAILINRLKENKRFYIYASVGILTLIQSLPFVLLFGLNSADFFPIVTFSSIKNGFCFFFIFFSLLLLAKERYLE